MTKNSYYVKKTGVNMYISISEKKNQYVQWSKNGKIVQ